MDNPKKILVMAYAISPSRGSEYAVAWNYIINMSKNNYLTVIYGMSDNHMGETDTLENYLNQQKVPNVRFVAVKPNTWANILNWPNRHNIFVYTFYYAFAVWHKQAYKKAKELIAQEQFDLIHFVGPIGYREPGYLWKLGLPYVWGPIGGANNAPWVLMKHMPLSGKIKQTFRSVANIIQFYTKLRLKKALAATDVLLTATSENQRKFRKAHHKNSICLPENGIVGEIKLDKTKFDNVERYKFVVVGRLDERKAVGILLEALTHIVNKQKLHIDIVGDGPLRSRLERYANEHSLDKLITWHGQLPRIEAVQVFNSAHLHVITSVSEGNPTTIWEAMSYGVPTLSFDHCGMHDTICDQCGVRIPIAKRYEDCILALSSAIDNLLEHPMLFQTLAEGTVNCAQKYTWNKRAIFLNNIYNQLLVDKRHDDI